jgi:hypothetical protein
MAGPLDALRQFFRPTQPTFAPPDSVFIKIDRKATADKLELEQRATAAANRELPHTDAESPDAVEAEIHSLIADQVDRAQIDYDNNVRVYANRLGALTLLGQLPTITGASQTAFGDFNSSVKIWQDRLTNNQDAIRESYLELAEFKQTHKLRRPALEQPPIAYTLSVFGISWIVEAIGNTAFLRVGDQYGLVGGFVAAAIIAFLNIGFGGFVGRKVWPQVLHIETIRKVVGWIFGFTWFALAVVWNLLAAHFRDAKADGIASPEVAALATFIASPFDLSSIYSYGLCGMGIVFAILAAIAGFKMDDPYPGYGPIYRQHKERCDDYSMDVEQAVDELRDIRDRAISDLQSINDELRVQSGERNQIAVAQLSLFSRYIQHQDYLEDVGRGLITQYRTINRDTRTSPAPRYFEEPWIMKRTDPPQPPPMASIDAEVGAAQQSLQTATTHISEAYQVATNSFTPLKSIKSSLEHD